MTVPQTSLQAYKQAQDEGLIQSHWGKILKAMEKIGAGNYEAIATAAGLDKIACMRRLSELETQQKIYKPGTQSKTNAGRKAYDYKLTTFSDHAKNLINLSQGKFF